MEDSFLTCLKCKKKPQQMHGDVIIKHMHIHPKLLKLETGELNREQIVYPTREEDEEKEIF